MDNDFRQTNERDDRSENQFIKTPSLTLPKGGGALKSIDEKFQVNAANGSAAFSIPLSFSKTRSDFAPALAINYNSGGGNSEFGLGWNLSLTSIQRRTDKQLPQYKDGEESDVFMFSGSEDLVPALKLNNGKWEAIEFTAATGEKVKRYRPRIEGEFSRIERITPQDRKTFYWKVTTKENVVTIYGRSEAARIYNPGDDSQIYKWLPELSYDDKGNCYELKYIRDNFLQVPNTLHESNRINGNAACTNTYLKRILYGNKNPFYVEENFYDPQQPSDPGYLFETVFDYDDHDDLNPLPSIQKDWQCRTDAFSEYKAGFEIRTYRLCRRVLFFHYFKELNDGINPAPCLVRSLDLSYKYFNNPVVTAEEARNAEVDFIIALQLSGYKKNNNGYSKKSFPPVEFTFQPLQWDTSVQTVTQENIMHAPEGINSKYQWVDLWSEGISGILSEQENAWYYKSNLGDGNFSAAELITPKPSLDGLATNLLQLADLEADGRKFIVSTQGNIKGYYEISGEYEWQPFFSFDQMPNINFNDPNAKLFDLNGDGKPDLIISEEFAFTWYPNKGIAGYDSAEISEKVFDEEKGPALVFSDQTQSIFLADMSGDGMTDIVRIRNGEICYWPNTGYGRFGAKVNMSFAPFFDMEDQFNPSYIHLADISGTGASDILYLGKNQFNAWLNLSGNAWSETVSIDAFPTVELPNQLTVLDFLGNGTACIVWSSPLPQNADAPIKYIDLMGGTKPYIMTGYKNNFGKEVNWEYKSSSFFYLQDKKAGTPWLTKLPFPVQCVKKITTKDLPSGIYFSSSYVYHHGYYDYPEREYRGFGKVEQLDTEVFEDFKLSGGSNIVEADLHQPPVKTITWFHTGLFFNKENILQHYKNEYWYEVMNDNGFAVSANEHELSDAAVKPAPGLNNNILDNLSAAEWREAARACKGMMLRQEIFAIDAPANGATNEQLQKQFSPYSVSTHNCFIELLQQKDENKSAVFTVKESEAITYNYERITNDPRIGHTFNLEMDEFGNVLKAASVVYGRKIKDPALPSNIQDEQDKLHVVFTVNDFTKSFDDEATYRLPLTAETKTYELTGIHPASGDCFTSNELVNHFSSALVLQYQDTADENFVQKRLIEDARVIYLANDLVTPLPLKQMDTLSFQSQKYQLAFTPSLVTHLYGTRVTNNMLTDAKYILLDGNWWIQSGTQVYLASAETIADAKQRFYAPIGVKDAYDIFTSLKYDDYFLALIETEDALQNKTSVLEMDYRTLQPASLNDMNNNISETLFDELGMVIASSMFGDETDGQHGDDPISIYNILQPADLDDVISNAAQFLQGATSYFYYDLFSWMNRSQPVCSATVLRETHQSELNGNATKVNLSVAYSSGIGQLLQTKMQAEPGIALQWQNNTLVEVDTNTALRWVGSGRTVFNNKGKVIKQYEPFFSTTFEYETAQQLVEIGFSSIHYYDPLSREIRVEHPDGTIGKTEFDSWKQLSYDGNDTVLDGTWYSDRGSPDPQSQEPADPEMRAAWLTAKHADTPAEMHFDSLGRNIYVIADNAAQGKYASRIVLDIENNQRSVIDARNNPVIQCSYNMIGRKAYTLLMDSGERHIFNDVMNKPLFAWDNMSRQFITEYDILHRPVKQFLIEDIVNNTAKKLIGFTVYGEGQLNDTQKNLRGRVFQNFDQSGLSQTDEFDFKGNVKDSFKQLASDYTVIVNYDVPDPFSLLETETFAGISRFDALNRAVFTRLPDSSTIAPAYNEAKFLKKVDVFINNQNTTVSFVQNISYNAKGQRESILYGNNTTTHYTYDEITYRLSRLLTTRNNGADILQDLNYTYDPVGNVTQVVDDAQQTIFFNNAAVDPSNKYEYDAIYRLINAQGREHAGQNAASDQFDNDKTNNGGGNRLTLKGDMNAMQAYEEEYLYDEVGNMLQMIHNAGNGIFQNKWTRTFNYAASNNQLASTQVGADITTYTYDPHGNLFNLQNGNFNIDWNYDNRLKQIDLGGGGTAYYVYDGAGGRVRKVIEGDGLIKERIYLGSFEVYREIKNNNTQLERQTIHVMDDKERIALIESLTTGEDDGLPFLIRYQYGNHLGTTALELTGDPNPEIITYEEYYPFGSTAYQATRNQTETAKRYRYTGKERDEESGLYYHGARYYAPWLARWVAADPIGIADGLNVYAYVKNSPVRKHDPSGTQGHDRTVRVTDPKPSLAYPPKKEESKGDEEVKKESTEPPPQSSIVVADIAVPDVNLAGRTEFRLDLGTTLPGDPTRRRLGITGKFKLKPQIDIPILKPQIAGDISFSGSTFSSAAGTPVPDTDVALSGFAGTATLSGNLEGLFPVWGKFKLQEEIFSEGATDLTFDAHLNLLFLPHVINLSGSGIATNDDMHIGGKFWAWGPGIAWGDWSYDRSRDLSIKANYIGLQFGPLGPGGFDPRPPVPSSPDDPPPILPDDQTGSLRRFGVVDTFNPGSVAVGYSKIWAHPLSKTYQALNFSFSWNTSISHNDMSRPSIFVFDLPGVGDLLKKGLDYNPSAADDTKLGVGAFVTYKAVF